MGVLLANLNGNIRAEMARVGINQGLLAQRLDMSQSAVSRRLTGQRDWGIGELVELTDILECSLSDLLDGTQRVAAA